MNPELLPQNKLKSWIATKCKDSFDTDSRTTVYGETEESVQKLCETIYGKGFELEDDYMR